MTKMYYRSKGIVYIVIFSFLLLLTSESVYAVGNAKREKERSPVVRIKKALAVSMEQQDRFEKALEEGKDLYNEMDNRGAVSKLREALRLAQTPQQKSDVYFYLSLAYYALYAEGQSNEFTATIHNLLEVDYNRMLDEHLCPKNYLEIYNEIKAGYGILRIYSRPAGADVFINDSRTSSGTTPLVAGVLAGDVKIEVRKGGKKARDTLQVIAGQETQTPEYELKGGSSMIYIVGGVLLGGGLAAALALGGGGDSGGGGGGGGGNGQPTTGNIQINSSPSGAQVFLDGNDRGVVTNTTLTNVSAGNHAVRLVKEGYVDFEEAVTVTAGQTSTVNAELSQHVINFSSPPRNSEWMVGDILLIQWELEPSSQGQGRFRSPVLSEVSSSSFNSRIQRSPVNRSDRSGIRPGFARGNSIRGTRAPTRSSHSAVTSALLPAARMRRTPYPAAGVSVPQNQDRLRSQNPSAFSQGVAGTLTLTSVKLDLLESGEFKQTIAASTENDGLFEWDIPKDIPPGRDYRVRISSTESENVSYNSPRFTIVGEAVRFVVDKEAVTVPEGGTASFRVKLSSQPEATVSVTVKRVSGDRDISVRTGDSLTFTRSNWNSYQKVVLACAVDGDAADGEAVIRISSPDIPNKNIAATEDDTVVVTAPAAPTNLTLQSLGGPIISLNWSDNSNNETSFRIERSVNGEGFVEYGSVGANNTSYNDRGVDVGNTYQYRVRAATTVSGFTVYSGYSNTVSVTLN